MARDRHFRHVRVRRTGRGTCGRLQAGRAPAHVVVGTAGSSHRALDGRFSCNAVFILGRAVTKADTTFLWASGAPVGLLLDSWNVRLIPHYSLGVWFVILHMGIGLREVLLDHGTSSITADRVAWAVGILGAAISVTITIAQLRVGGA